MSVAPTPMPLRSSTSAAWARAALAEPVALLEDHGHLERKAAANALALLSRWPQEWEGGARAADADHWCRALTRVARDEIEHLGLVLRHLEERGAGLGRIHANPYAGGLRRLVRQGSGREELVDRLLVSALIEARSCERFERLSEHAADDPLRRLYRGLLASERGHYRLFLDLAARVAPTSAVDARWEVLLAAEAGILAAQPPGPRMHSGEPPEGAVSSADSSKGDVQ